MPYSNDSKPSSSYLGDSEAQVATSIAGTPMGLLLALTYATTIGELYTVDSRSSSSYINDSK